MKKTIRQNLIREMRKRRSRARISSSSESPRLTVFRSNKYIYAQLIDDEAGKTLASVSTLNIKKGKKAEQAKEVGQKLAEQAKKLGIKKAIFDRGAYKFHGRVKALAEGAREGGLKF